MSECERERRERERSLIDNQEAFSLFPGSCCMQSQNARIEEKGDLGHTSRLIHHPTLLARFHSLHSTRPAAHSTRPAAHSSCWPQSCAHTYRAGSDKLCAKVQDFPTCADLHHFLTNLPARTLFRLANPLQREAWTRPPLPAP